MSTPTPASTPAPMTGPVLHLSRVSLAYGDVPVLHDVSLDVAPHECVVLIGASGSGKSTLLRAVGLLEEITDGEMHLRGDDIADPRIDANKVRARLGIVFQAYNLLTHLDVLGNLTLALRLVHGRTRAQATAEAMAMLDRVGLADRAKAKPHELSGGQQQRVAIARALVSAPELLLLDEVTSALDRRLVAEVEELLVQVRNEGATMLIATHELGFARRVADRIAFLHDGVLRAVGTPEWVLDECNDPHLQAYLGR